MGDSAPFGYVPDDTPIHALDPRTKLLCVIAVTAVLFSTRTASAGAFEAVGILAAVISAKIGWSYLRRSYRTFAWVGILLFATVLLTTPGKPLFSVALPSVTQEGLAAGILQLFRLYAFATLWSVLAYAASPGSLTDGIETMAKPLAKLGMPVREAGMVLMIAFRFVPVLLDEADRIIAAQRSRGCDIGRGNPVRRIKNLVPVFVPLFVKALRRAEELAGALESRGFMDGRTRTRFRPLALKPKDVSAVAVTALFCLAAAWLESLYSR